MSEKDELSQEVFTCMWCNKQCGAEEGTWPQIDLDGEIITDADRNDRTRDEFVCYDCLD